MALCAWGRRVQQHDLFGSGKGVTAMTAYQGLLVLKFLSVMGFAGGAIAALLSTDVGARKHAVHRVASPSLLVVWLCGYGLVLVRGWPLFELWIVASVLLSLWANGMLAYCVARNRRGTGAFLKTALPVVAIVVLMVLKPSWNQVLP